MNKIMNALPWRRLIMIGKPFWTSEARMSGFLHLGGVLALLAANAGVNYLVNRTAGAWMTSIEKKHIDDFYYYLMVYGGLILAAAPVSVYYGWLRTRLALVWREWLSSTLFDGYFSNQAYLKMTRDKEMDNPDQRMAQDVDSFCNTAVGLFISLLDAIVNVVMMAGVLYTLSGRLTLIVIAYSAIGSLIVVLIGKGLVALSFTQIKSEADLRFGLAEVRREADGVALYRGEQLARAKAKLRLRKVIATLMNIMNVNRNIQFFTNPYNMLVAVIPPAIMAPLYFSGKAQFGDITQATMAFATVFNGATFLIGQFGGITNFTTIINRLGSFREGIEAAGVEQIPPGKRIEVSESNEIAFDRVTISTSDFSRNLIVDLTVDIGKGKSLLVTGPDGSGKSAVLHVLAGIWRAGTGKLNCPSTMDVMYLDKAPYLPPMTLREALCFPVREKACDDERLKQILNLVDLPDLVTKSGGLDTEQNWREILSPSQQQRLALARVINLKPKYAVVDEASAALEAENEKLLYTVLAALGTTVVSAGNGNALAKYHTQVLELAGDGSWKLYPASEYQPKTWRPLKFLDSFLKKDEES